MNTENEQQKLIDTIVAMAYGGSKVEFELQDVIEDYGKDYIGMFVPISLEMIAGFDGEGFNDNDLIDYLGLDAKEVITDETRIRYAYDLFKRCDDADIHPMSCGNTIADSNSRTALIGYEIYGYSFSGIEHELVGVYMDEDEFREQYRKRDYLIQDEEVEDNSVFLKYWVS